MAENKPEKEIDYCAFENAIRNLELISKGLYPGKDFDLDGCHVTANIGHAKKLANAVLPRLEAAYVEILTAHREARRDARIPDFPEGGGPAKSGIARQALTPMGEAGNEWYFDCNGHYIDVKQDADGTFSIFFKNRTDLTEAWYDQADKPSAGVDATLQDLLTRARFHLNEHGVEYKHRRQDELISEIDAALAGSAVTSAAPSSSDNAGSAPVSATREDQAAAVLSNAYKRDHEKAVRAIEVAAEFIPELKDVGIISPASAISFLAHHIANNKPHTTAPVSGNDDLADEGGVTRTNISAYLRRCIAGKRGQVTASRNLLEVAADMLAQNARDGEASRALSILKDLRTWMALDKPSSRGPRQSIDALISFFTIAPCDSPVLQQSLRTIGPIAPAAANAGASAGPVTAGWLTDLADDMQYWGGIFAHAISEKSMMVSCNGYDPEYWSDASTALESMRTRLLPFTRGYAERPAKLASEVSSAPRYLLPRHAVILRTLLQDYLVSEDEYNSVEFDAVFGRYGVDELLFELVKRVSLADTKSDTARLSFLHPMYRWMARARFESPSDERIAAEYAQQIKAVLVPISLSPETGGAA